MNAYVCVCVGVCVVAHVNAIVYLHINGVYVCGLNRMTTPPPPYSLLRTAPKPDDMIVLMSAATHSDSTATRKCSTTYLPERRTF